MKISDVIETKNGYVYIDTCSLDNPLGNLIDEMGLGNNDAIGKKYETMVFKYINGKVEYLRELDKKNYNTKVEAIKGHKKMIKKYKK